MDYIIGAGAILESGEDATITPATLHARVDPVVAHRVRVLAIDLEGTSESAIARLLVFAAGWDSARFRAGVTDPLRGKGDCNLADVLEVLASASGAPEVHIFAHWLPSEETCRDLRARGVEVIAHPLETIEAASLVSGQRHRRWHAA